MKEMLVEKSKPFLEEFGNIVSDGYRYYEKKVAPGLFLRGSYKKGIIYFTTIMKHLRCFWVRVCCQGNNETFTMFFERRRE